MLKISYFVALIYWSWHSFFFIWTRCCCHKKFPSAYKAARADFWIALNLSVILFPAFFLLCVGININYTSEMEAGWLLFIEIHLLFLFTSPLFIISTSPVNSIAIKLLPFYTIYSLLAVIHSLLMGLCCFLSLAGTFCFFFCWK